MLSEIRIKGLYGLYTYALSFHPDRQPFCFVTGSNGYGKTTLLKMLDALYNLDFDRLSSIEFGEFELFFQDGYDIHISQNRMYDSDSSSDETEPNNIVLSFRAKNENEFLREEEIVWESNKAEEKRLNNMTAYLSSHPIYFITDKRLYKGGSELTIGETLENLMKEFLQKVQLELNTALQRGMMKVNSPISKEDYDSQVSSLQPLIDSIMKYELVEENPIPAYSVEQAAFCHTCITALENALDNDVLGDIARLDALSLIIENYEFANKHLELSPYFGFRFRVNDENGTFLSFDQLSSGEQHIMLMNYDILFDVVDETLVLIDEPELSFHIEWQGQFMFNLKEMVAARKDLQFIICTHAPEMFGYEWGLSVDLYEQSTHHQ